MKKAVEWSAGEAGLLSLLSHALFGAPLSLPAACDFKEIYRLANAHMLFGVVGEGLSSLPEDAVPCELMLRWQSRTVSLLRQNAALLSLERRVLDAFLREKIPVIILKGSTVARLYPTPDLRVAGDVDCLVPVDEVSHAAEVLTALGLEERPTAARHHRSFFEGKREVELHFAVPGIPEGEAGKRISDFFEDAFDNLRITEFAGYSLPMLSPTHQAVMLLLHIREHMRDGGVGLRQICDFAITLQKDVPREIGEAMLPLLHQFGLGRLFEALVHGCVRHLGLPAEAVSYCTWRDDAVADALFADFMAAGNFGMAGSAYAGSAIVTKERKKGEGAFLSALRGVAGHCRGEWPVSARHPSLLLFLVPFWILRRLLSKKRRRVKPFSMLKSTAARSRLYDTLGIFDGE